MQVQGAGLNKSVFNYDGIFSALRRIYLEEGLSKGLFKGLTLTWIKGPFSVAIAFTINDRLKGALGGWWAEQPEKAEQPELLPAGSQNLAPGGLSLLGR